MPRPAILLQVHRLLHPTSDTDQFDRIGRLLKHYRGRPEEAGRYWK
jgi:hypothetical protein